MAAKGKDPNNLSTVDRPSQQPSALCSLIQAERSKHQRKLELDAAEAQVRAKLAQVQGQLRRCRQRADNLGQGLTDWWWREGRLKL